MHSGVNTTHKYTQKKVQIRCQTGSDTSGQNRHFKQVIPHLQIKHKVRDKDRGTSQQITVMMPQANLVWVCDLTIAAGEIFIVTGLIEIIEGSIKLNPQRKICNSNKLTIVVS